MLEAAKQCDRAFGVPPKSTAHTVADTESDIKKLQQQLLDKGVTKQDPNRTTPPFEDATEIGLSKLTKGEWLQKHLSQWSYDEDLQSEEHQGEVDTDYELSDVV